MEPLDAHSPRKSMNVRHRLEAVHKALARMTRILREDLSRDVIPTSKAESYFSFILKPQTYI